MQKDVKRHQELDISGFPQEMILDQSQLLLGQPRSDFREHQDAETSTSILRHNNDIAVFMDFVGAHFAKDEWGLVEYCGVPQYEYEGSQGEIPGWGTARYNYAKAEVQAYLLGSSQARSCSSHALSVTVER